MVIFSRHPVPGNMVDHNIDTDSSLESFISLGNLCKLTPPALGLLQHTATKVVTTAQYK